DDSAPRPAWSGPVPLLRQRGPVDGAAVLGGALQRQEERLAVLDAPRRVAEVRQRADLLPVDLHDHVAGADVGAAEGLAAALDVRHEHAPDVVGEVEAAGRLAGRLAERHAEHLLGAARGLALRGAVAALAALGRLVVGTGAEADGGRASRVVADVVEGELVTGAAVGDEREQLARGAELAAVDGHDHVAGFEAGLGGRRAGLDRGHLRRAYRHGEGAGERLRDRPELDAEVAALDVARLDELLDDVLDDVHGDGEADALEAAAPRRDGRVDADDPAAEVHERAAGVAGVD